MTAVVRLHLVTGMDICTQRQRLLEELKDTPWWQPGRKKDILSRLKRLQQDCQHPNIEYFSSHIGYFAQCLDCGHLMAV